MTIEFVPHGAPVKYHGFLVGASLTGGLPMAHNTLHLPLRRD